VTPIVCQGCGAHVGAGANFCATCGKPLGAAQRSTGQLRLVEQVVLETLAKLGDGAPADLTHEGELLTLRVRHWGDLSPEERRETFDRMVLWSSAVSKWSKK
jgi:hypothetical protein